MNKEQRLLIYNMFNTAESFHRVAHDIIPEDWLDNEEHDGHWFVPSVVNMAFSCELYLKTLLTKHNVLFKGHNLKKLFDSLPESIISNIREVPEFMGNDFNRRLEENSELFIDWRYFYEPEKSASVDVIFLEKFALTLHDITNKEINMI